MENFKKWFKLMWKGFYIQSVVMALAFIYAVYCYRHDFKDAPEGLLILLIPIAVIAVVSYFGFYKFWQKNKD